MLQEEIFKDAQWVCFDPKAVSVNARKKFFVRDNIVNAEINIIGLGFFELFMNGEKVSDDLFLPLNSDYHKRTLIRRGEPFTEETNHRIYAVNYNVTDFIVLGSNVICVMLGNGWYADEYQEKFGDKKLIFSLVLEYKSGEKEYFYSDPAIKWHLGFVTKYCFTCGQEQNYTDYADNWLCSDFDDSRWKNADACVFPETEYCFSDCPPDRIREIIVPSIIRSDIGRKVYDIGINTSGTPILRLKCGKNEKVRLVCAEEVNSENDVTEDNCCWGQISEFISDGKERIVTIRFSWNACRYFAVEGNADVLGFARIFTDVDQSSSFDTSETVLKWYYDAFINTQLSNMHSGIPSDCPHLERRGYTGDGELAADAVMYSLDARSFYKKWLIDISDCQDRLSGHVQYTAPYTHSGGGPGGWGCAIVHVPYLYYRHYGDISYMKQFYPQMLEYFRFLDEHSENGLITSDVPNEWCLGDWCTARKISIPAPFVNNYFYIRSIDEILLCAVDMELSVNDINALKMKRRFLVDAINSVYFDSLTGNFAENIQGANAFAVDIGIGNSSTLDNLVEFYENLGMFDTGIFGTDILTRVLFEHGYGSLAYKLLTADKLFSFERIRSAGATSLWEYWTGRRSHSHPMFGAAVAYLFKFILGIHTPDQSHSDIYIEPCYIGRAGKFSGTTVICNEKVTVCVEYTDNSANFEIDISCNSELIFQNNRYTLKKGKNVYPILLN